MSPLSILAVVCAFAACAHGNAVREVPVPSAAASSYPFATFPLGLDRGRSSDVDPQIVGGRDAAVGEFPHQASMQVVMPGFLWWDAEPQHICGGTLVAENWVMTAAHCVYGVPSSAKRVEVVVGITSLSAKTAGSQRIRVTKMLAHAQYDSKSNGGVGPYDIALLKLASSAKLSDTVKLGVLPVANALFTGTATLSGWGSTSEDGDYPVYPDKLQTADFPIVEYDTCHQYVSQVSPNEPNPLADTNLCVGPLDRTGLSSCSGDSGGPLIQRSGSDAIVIGVVSWGLKDCASFPFPSVFTRTSAYVDWIQSTQQQY